MRRGLSFFARAFAAVALILLITGMHTALGAAVMPDASAISMTGESQTTVAPDAAIAFVDEVFAAPDSTSKVMQVMMHDCIFLIAVAAFAVLASPVFVIWGPRLLLRVFAPRRRRESGGIDRLLALCVLRI